MAVTPTPAHRSTALSRVTLCEVPAAAWLLAKAAAPSKAWAAAALPMWLLGTYLVQPHLLRLTVQADLVPPKQVVGGVVIIVPPGQRQVTPTRALTFAVLVSIGVVVPMFAVLGGSYIFGGRPAIAAANIGLGALSSVLCAIVAISVIAALYAGLRDFPGRLPRSKSPLDRAAVRVFSASSDMAASPLIWAARGYIQQTYPGCRIELEARDLRLQRTYERLGLTPTTPGHSKMVGTVPGERG